jgi:hypothetical protein
MYEHLSKTNLFCLVLFISAVVQYSLFRCLGGQQGAMRELGNESSVQSSLYSREKSTILQFVVVKNLNCRVLNPVITVDIWRQTVQPS